MPDLSKLGIELEVAEFIKWLWPKHQQQDAAGALSRFVRANAPDNMHAEASAYFQKQIDSGMLTATEVAGRQAFLTACPHHSTQRWQSVTAMKTMIGHFGPNVTVAQFDSALATWRAS